MSRILLLATALEYVENNLTGDIKTEDVAQACYCSKSTLEKMFQNVNHISVRDYIIRRRMMKGARLLLDNQEQSILDIALSVGYGSNEAFARAFKQVWNCKPSEFRKNNKSYVELFPRLCPPIESADEYLMGRRNVDISELYDLFVERKNCYFICCDIKHMIAINEISMKAGDMAILEAIRRMTEAAGDEDVVFRVGGDEFAMLTNSEDKAYAESVQEKITALNGNTYSVDGQEIPLTLYAGIMTLESKTIKYNEMFSKLHEVIRESKYKFD